MAGLKDRMIGYENVSRYVLTKRTPVIVRVDGRAFHTFTRKHKVERPFSRFFTACMDHSARLLSEEIQGFKVGYVQSDEASFLITDFDTLETDSWFGYNVQKISSICASIMSARFSFMFKEIAVFDARCFNIPLDDVTNYFLYRAKDWSRNSLCMLSMEHFSHNKLHGKSDSDRHEMLHSIGINWNDIDPRFKNGYFFSRDKSSYSILPKFDDINDFISSNLKENSDE